MPPRVVADHDDIRLTAVQKPRRHAGERRVIERALSFDDVPMIGRSIRAEQFGCAGFEIGDNGIHGDAAADPLGTPSPRVRRPTRSCCVSFYP